MEVTTMENNIQENEVEYTEKINMLTEQIHQLENEKKTISEEFNVQRAKMKELFLQKEAELKQNAAEKLALREEVKKIQTELNETRSQLCVADLRLESDLEVEKRKAQEEIATLQQLFQETMEESTCSRSLYDTELKKLKLFTQQLQTENSELRSLIQQNSPHHTSSESSSLAPSIMLSAVTKTLARKLGADAHSNQENLEESMRRAQEDAEVLRSLVVPLEEEIHALKDKLRSTDEQLQQCRLCGHNPDNKSIGLAGSSTETSPIKDTKSTPNNLIDISNAEATSPTVNSTLTTQLNTSTSSQNYEDDDKKSSPVPTCDMCNNYETQLVQEQQNVNELRKKLIAAEKILERQKEDLTKEISFRKDMEEKWNEKKEEHKEKVAELNKKTLCAEQDLQELRQTFEQTQIEITEKLSRLTKEREQVREHLNKVQQENDNLVGKHSIHSQQLQNEMINLPSDVDELQLLLLKSHEDLITAIVAKEVALEQQESLRCEIQLMRDQMIIEQQTRQELENTLVAENDSLKQELHRITKESASTLELHRNLVEALRVKKILEEHNSELKSRVSALQQELDNSEQVQKDFVRLSQSLQVELEKIRASDTQVRWQYEEDIEECPGCRNAFVGQRSKKIHCRHCGQIFCVNCLSHTVLSGPNRRPSKVCGVCHTLLNRNTAPYFSTEAPHLPD